jgi:hypothetical protein
LELAHFIFSAPLHVLLVKQFKLQQLCSAKITWSWSELRYFGRAIKEILHKNLFSYINVEFEVNYLPMPLIIKK